MHGVLQDACSHFELLAARCAVEKRAAWRCDPRVSRHGRPLKKRYDAKAHLLDLPLCQDDACLGWRHAVQQGRRGQAHRRQLHGAAKARRLCVVLRRLCTDRQELLMAIGITEGGGG